MTFYIALIAVINRQKAAANSSKGKMFNISMGVCLKYNNPYVTTHAHECMLRWTNEAQAFASYVQRHICMAATFCRRWQRRLVHEWCEAGGFRHNSKLYPLTLRGLLEIYYFPLDSNRKLPRVQVATRQPSTKIMHSIPMRHEYGFVSVSVHQEHK